MKRPPKAEKRYGDLMVVCVACKQSGYHNARGLCNSCYRLHYKAGTLHKFPLRRPIGKTIPPLDGFSYRQLHYWVGQGYLRPENQGGSGRPWSWPESELNVLAAMIRLVKAGLPPSTAARIARGEAEAPDLKALVAP